VHLVCSTTRAASQVIVLLFRADLRPITDFQIGPALSFEPPIVFSMVEPLPDAILEHICIIPDIVIERTATT
jgi:hypothetical protein